MNKNYKKPDHTVTPCAVTAVQGTFRTSISERIALSNSKPNR